MSWAPTDDDTAAWLAEMRHLFGDSIETPAAPPLFRDICDQCDGWGAEYVPAQQRRLCAGCNEGAVSLRDRWEAAE